LPTNIDSCPTLILAPIRGITDVVYREAFAQCFGGFDRAIAPYIQPRRGHELRPVELKQVVPEPNQRMVAIPQVLTNDARTFAATLRELHNAGHMEVNWNLGCPTPNVAGRVRGSGLLPHPERIDKILTHVLTSTPVRLSAKIRLGYKDPDEHLAVMEVLNRHPLTEVILHARTGAQKYQGSSDWERAAEALAQCRHPFIYNGDITDPGGFTVLQEKLAGAAGWMIGRGALKFPFLPALLKAGSHAENGNRSLPALPEPEARVPQLREFHDLLYAGYRKWLSGPRHLLDRMRSHWTYLSHSFADPNLVANRLRNSSDQSSYLANVQWAFEQPVSQGPLSR
jgi:tRNA-dihydrouridine synthase B